MNAKQNNAERIGFVTFLQFIGPIFVIFGHSSNLLIATESIYWMISKTWVYMFHMPLFFFISGYLFEAKGNFGKIGFKEFIKKKFRRLMIPYILWNILFAVPKVLFQPYVADKVEVSLAYFLRVFFSPRENILGHTWFLFALFEMFLLAFVLVKVCTWKKTILLTTLLVLLLRFFPLQTNLFALSDICKNIMWFWFGMLLGRIPYSVVMEQVVKHRVIISIGTVISTFLYLHNQSMTIFSIICCACTLTLFIYLSNVFPVEKVNWYSRHSFSIYLMHWPVMYLVRTILIILFTDNPFIVVPVIAILGFCIPCIVIKVTEKMKESRLKQIIQFIICY